MNHERHKNHEKRENPNDIDFHTMRGASRAVPKLRFPEFEKKAGWALRTFGDMTSPIARRNKDNKAYPIYSISNAAGFVPQSEQFDGVDSHSRGYDISLYKVIERNTFAYNPARINVGSLGYSGDLNNVLISSLYVCFKTNNDLDDAFLLHYLKGNQFNQAVNRQVEGGIRSYLFYENLAQIKFAVPSIAEQQKIADCLTSLDELIATEGQKLDALKVHKKGLMQQLFPAEGETVPERRFPEFRDSGEWEEMILSDLCERLMDGTHFSPKSKTGTRLYLTSKNIQNGAIDLSNISYISDEEHRTIYEKCPVKKYDVLLTKDGANTGNCAINNIEDEFSLLSSVAVLRGKPNILNHNFLYQSILSDRIQKLIQESMSGQAITRITLQKIGAFALPITNLDEQRKIADCLSALDELIAAQAEKIEALKLQKKGLMQGLFPQQGSSE